MIKKEQNEAIFAPDVENGHLQTNTLIVAKDELHEDEPLNVITILIHLMMLLSSFFLMLPSSVQLLSRSLDDVHTRVGEDGFAQFAHLK